MPRPCDWAVVGLLLTAACDDRPQQLPTPVASSVPPVAIDESGLPEGKLEIFNLKLPFGSTVQTRTPDSLLVDVPFSQEQVATYLRARLEGGKVEIGPRATVFRGAAVKGVDSPIRVLVFARRAGGSTEVSVVRDPSATVAAMGSAKLGGTAPRKMPGRPEGSARPPPAPSAPPSEDEEPPKPAVRGE